MLKFEKEKRKLDEIVYKRGGYLPEADHEYDNAVMSLIKAFTKFHGSAYLVDTWSKKIKKIKAQVKEFNGINQFKYITKDKKTAEYILKESRANASELLDSVHNGEIDAEYLMWT